MRRKTIQDKKKAKKVKNIQCLNSLAWIEFFRDFDNNKI